MQFDSQIDSQTSTNLHDHSVHILRADTDTPSVMSLPVSSNTCVSPDRVQSRDEASPLRERDHAQPEQQEPAVRRWQSHATDTSHDFQSKSPGYTCVFTGPKLWFWSCWQPFAWCGAAMTSSSRPSTTSKRFLLTSMDLLSDSAMELLPVLCTKLFKLNMKEVSPKVALSDDNREGTKNGKAGPLRPLIYIIRTARPPGAVSARIIHLRRTTTRSCSAWDAPLSNNKTGQWKWRLAPEQGWLTRGPDTG